MSNSVAIRSKETIKLPSSTMIPHDDRFVKGNDDDTARDCIGNDAPFTDIFETADVVNNDKVRGCTPCLYSTSNPSPSGDDAIVWDERVDTAGWVEKDSSNASWTASSSESAADGRWISFAERDDEKDDDVPPPAMS